MSVDVINSTIVGGDAPEEWSGVVKLQVPIVSTEEQAPIMMYPEGRPWVVLLKPGTKLYALVRRDKMWGGMKTYTRAQITRGKVALEDAGHVGFVW